MGAGVDPHLYKASPADVTAMIRADIIFYSGLHLKASWRNCWSECASASRRSPWPM
jgi:manganese/zinc/iron transport system substrate-binding protein